MSPRSLVIVCLAFTGGACSPKPVPLPVPGPLRAGVATAVLDAPVGVPMGGYGRPTKPTEQGSPYAARLFASTGVHVTPTARAIALSDDVTKVVFVRTDVCLTTSSLRFAAERKLRDRGYPVPLVVVATHTHAGPARYFRPVPTEGAGSFDPTALAMDLWDAELEDRLSTSIADAAAQALDALVPAAMGFASVDGAELNRDRRCENDDLYGPGYKDSTLTVVRLDQVDDRGAPVKPLAGLVHFSVHGTMLGGDNALFSSEVPGAIELYGSDEVGVPLLFLQGSAGDVSPNSTGVGGLQGIERLGRVAAPLVATAFARAQPTTRPERATLKHFEQPVDLSREAVGYARGEFAEFGALGCGLAGGSCPPIASEPKDVLCLSLKRREFSQTSVVALRLEDLLFVTLPGEPTTAIGARVKALGAEVQGVSKTLVLGYAQDHFGYLLEEPDYLRLGYEPSVSPWGWKFGDFIVGQAGAAVTALGSPQPALAMPEVKTAAPRVPADSLSGPRVEQQVAPELERLGAARLTLAGGDPGLGTPEARLEREALGSFSAMPASAVRAVVGGPELLLRYRASPTFVEDKTATARVHTWTVEWETLPSTPVGRYRLVVKGRAKVAGAVMAYELVSAPFEVKASRAAGATATAEVASDGALAVAFRFPPNPPLYDADGVPSGNYRLRDPASRPEDGALVKGGAASATVTLPDASTRPVTLTWDEAARAHVARGLPAQAGTYRVKVDAGAVIDGDGNTNAAIVDLSVSR